MNNYANITFNDKNSIKRWLQKKRLKDAISILTKIKDPSKMKILDFGAGNGELCRFVADDISFADAEIVCYEPAATLFQEACQNLARFNIPCCSNVIDIPHKQFNVIFCLEVFEHLPAKQTLDVITTINNLLSDNGLVIIGVPHELYLPALFKGLFRMTRRLNGFDTNWKNILQCTLGFPPKERPVGKIDSLPYHFEHLGFDYRNFKALLQQYFLLLNVFFSPVKYLGPLVNSEVYFVLKKF
jgi:SAM-dependent methyltransferase